MIGLASRVPAKPHAATASYGADADGLICGFCCEAKRTSEIDARAAAAWLARSPESTDGFLWLHFHLGHNGSLRWLAAHADLPTEFFDALKDGVRSTRLERAEDALVAVINDVHFDFTFEPSDLSTLWLAVTPRLVVSARLHPLHSTDRLRAALRAGGTLRSAVELLQRLLRTQADVLVDIVRSVTHRVDQVEDDLLAGKLREQRARLGALRRLLVRLQRLLAPEPAALFRLLQHPPGWVVDDDLQELRESTEEFSAVLRDMAALQERIKLVQEEIAEQVSERTSRSLFVLTVVTVLALPINLMAGLFGMNVGGIPLADHPHGFWLVLSLVASVTGVGALLALQNRNRDR